MMVRLFKAYVHILGQFKALKIVGVGQLIFAVAEVCCSIENKLQTPLILVCHKSLKMRSSQRQHNQIKTNA